MTPTIRRTCPSCKAINVGSGTRCLLCESPLPSLPPATVPQTCNACGAEILDPKARYCPQCATEIRPASLVCPACRASVVDPQAMFCPRCASPLRPQADRSSQPRPAAARPAPPTQSPKRLKPVARRQMERLARALRAAGEAGHLSDDLFRSMHAQLHAVDADGSTWTIALKSGRWHRRTDGRWSAAEPPDALLLDANLYDALTALPDPPPDPAPPTREVRPMAERRANRNTEPEKQAESRRQTEPAKRAEPIKKPTPARVSRREMERLASSLQAARKGGHLSPALFQSMHVRFQATDAHGNLWTVGLQGLIWHRRREGAWTAASPPDELFLPEDLYRAMIALPAADPPRPSTASCPHCGASLSNPKAAFCAHCGQAIRPSQAHSLENGPAAGPKKQAHTPQSLNCASCGATLRPGVKHCTKCGQPRAH